MRPQAWSNSYLFRDPLGISTITSTSMRRPLTGGRDLCRGPGARQAEEGRDRRRRPCRTGLSGRGRGSILRSMAGSKPSVIEAPRSPGKVDVAYYEKELARLQVELVKQQEYIRARGLRVV